jgi:16S rRNA processing protein RimM
VESSRPHKQFFLLKLKGFDTPEAVETLRNMTLEVDRDAVAPLPPGHYYIFDLVGMNVFTETGEALGVISDVLETGSNDVYVVDQRPKEIIKNPDLREACDAGESHGSPKTGQKIAHPPQILIPALKSVVLEISVPDKKMVVRLPEGLI